CCQHSSGYTF
nr:immunoglobulin light chain junction region [Macaca mulatta]MOX84546.1 immunoglobulin light chain junction region [Macaca mulatta]MOX84586.1 immunoglobulin light chain junction region [Macaca mulatta]MOX84888.1 immunoglobulin light chain junction region [Macaca mulatta]MOX84906.1 immunoglobulin light chain junction region [Macaca mulatta]